GGGVILVSWFIYVGTWKAHLRYLTWLITWLYLTYFRFRMVCEATSEGPNAQEEFPITAKHGICAKAHYLEK
ncbi:hypothetical protein F4810DRAFT_653434, partial [Camillea tinctor]